MNGRKRRIQLGEDPFNDRPITPEEADARFEEAAQRELGLTGDEFIVAWYTGLIDPCAGPRTDRVHFLMQSVYLLAQPLQPCARCGFPMLAIKGNSFAVCRRCGYKDDCC